MNDQERTYVEMLTRWLRARRDHKDKTPEPSRPEGMKHRAWAELRERTIREFERMA